MVSNTSDRLRPPRFADNRWYSADSSKLQKELQGYLANTLPSPANPIGLVAPHAGYFFSGHVAGAAFAGLTPNSFDTVVLIGPDHHGAAPGAISTPQVEAWRTPLGDVPVAWDVLQALHTELGLTFLPTDQEHSLEVELPFLQMTLHQFGLVPLMMGSQSPETCRRLGQALVKVLSASPGQDRAKTVLLVASSDLSHYFDDSTARQLDQTTLQFILNLDDAGLLQHTALGRRQGQPLACGAGPIAVMLHTATGLGATRASLLKYATSADVYPNKDRVVGYAAVAVSK